MVNHNVKPYINANSVVNALNVHVAQPRPSLEFTVTVNARIWSINADVTGSAFSLVDGARLSVKVGEARLSATADDSAAEILARFKKLTWLAESHRLTIDQLEALVATVRATVVQLIGI